MSALLVLVGGSSNGTTTDYSDTLPCDPDEVPTVPSAYLVPTFSRRGQCREQGVTGASNTSPGDVEGFEDFVEEVLGGAEDASDETPFLFGEASLRMYRAVPFGVHQTGVYINWVRSRLGVDGAGKKALLKRKASQSDT